MGNNKILFADDDPEIRDALQLLLAAEGYETIEASCGKEVLEKMEYISSSIMNYADRNCTVRITTTSQENSFCISVQASIGSDRANDVCIKSYIAPIDTMMKKMNGKCQIQTQEGLFAITLYFPTL